MQHKKNRFYLYRTLQLFSFIRIRLLFHQLNSILHLHFAVSIAPQVSLLTQPPPITPHRPRFHSAGFAVFLEKGETGKLCAEGLDAARDRATRRTVAESLCKALGYERLLFAEVRNDTEPDQHYVKVLDPRAEEISFVRTACPRRQALYVSCGELGECEQVKLLRFNRYHIKLLQLF